MFTKQELEWLVGVVDNHNITGTLASMTEEMTRYTTVMLKLDLLLADHPEDEEAGKKPAAKKPAAKKPAAKKPAAKK